MRRAAALLGSAGFLVLAPGTVAGLGPWLITRWREPGAGGPWMTAAGAVLALFGLVVLLECFGRFAWIGRGTPAPVAPTERLVVSGFYRRVRNPMYVAVLSLVFGQALVFAAPWLAAYGLAVWGGFHIFVLAYEEPTLRRTHPQAYADYVRNVPRWIPRLKPWRP